MALALSTHTPKVQFSVHSVSASWHSELGQDMHRLAYMQCIVIFALARVMLPAVQCHRNSLHVQGLEVQDAVCCWHQDRFS